ncbi:MAG: AraC family transcriptional regulator [Planctomycetota bacterium]
MPTTAPRARRRFADPAAAGRGVDAWRRAVCAAVFDNPGRIADALSHRITRRFEVPAHRHADLLQLDVVHRCRGESEIDGRATPLGETTLLLAPPGRRHGYMLHPAGRDAAVWLIKLRLGRGATPPLPHAVTDPQAAAALLAAASGFVRGWTPKGVGTLSLCDLARLIALWPSSSHETATVESRDRDCDRPPVGDGPSARVRHAAETLGARLDDPPDLAELAAAARLSPRHFSRRFRLDFGCTPHAYLQARRLDAARGLLRDADRRVAGVAEQLGFSSPAAFSRWFTRLVGTTPRAFRDDPRKF